MVHIQYTMVHIHIQYTMVHLHIRYSYGTHVVLTSRTDSPHVQPVVSVAMVLVLMLRGLNGFKGTSTESWGGGGQEGGEAVSKREGSGAQNERASYRSQHRFLTITTHRFIIDSS